MERYRPMLAVPFDAPEYLFEIKWNGVRALAGSTAGAWRLWGRDLADYGDRYPELAGLGRLPCRRSGRESWRRADGRSGSARGTAPGRRAPDRPKRPAGRRGLPVPAAAKPVAPFATAAGRPP